MAQHNYRCPACRAVVRDVNVPIAIGAVRGAPDCPSCSTRTEWIPQIGRMDVGGVKTAAFTAFDTTDAFGRPVRIDSFHKLHQIERESEHAYANGDGQLLRWRDCYMDRSNRDVHSIAKQPDRPMDMQDQPRVEANPTLVHRGAEAARFAEALPDHVPFSLDDALPEGGD